MPDTQSINRDAGLSWFGRSVLAIVLTLIAIVPTLGWLEFSSGSENLVVAAAMETRREGNWLVPTLMGEPRVKKPPLVTWIAAASITAADLEAIRADASARDSRAAYGSMQNTVRWPLAIVLAVTLLATHWLGSIALGSRGGWISVVVVASSLLFLRFIRNTTTDVYLLMFVAVATAAMAHSMLRRGSLLLSILIAAAAGLAFLSKGPVALLMIVAPWLAAWPIYRWRPAWGRIVIAAVLFLAIAAPWFALVLHRHPQVAQTWFTEVSRHNATGNAPSSVFHYLSLPGFLFPWSVCFIVGMLAAWRDVKMPLLLVGVPLLVMSFFPDRKERYMLPLLVPAAVIAAGGFELLLARWNHPNRSDRMMRSAHLLGLAIVAVGVPLICAGLFPGVRRLDGGPWLAAPLSITAGIVLACVLLLTAVVSKRSWPAMLWGTLGGLLVAQIAVMQGYAASREGLSEMRPMARAIREKAADAELFHISQSGQLAPADLAIYANRIVRPAKHIADLQAGDLPQVLLLRQGKRDAEPFVPEGFSLLARTPRDDNWWWAFIRRAGAQPTPGDSLDATR